MKQKAKVIKALFMLLISTCFCSLCMTFAWFTAQRIRDVSGTNLNLTALNGEMYYYSGNYNQSGSDKEWSGYLGNIEQKGLNKSFEKYVKPVNPGDEDAFDMSSMKPSSRFLFFIKAKLTHPNPVNVRLQIDSWQCNTSEVENKKLQSGETIYLSRAMYMYAGTPIAVTDENNLTAPMTSVIDWADTLVVTSNSDANIYGKNKFINEDGSKIITATNTTGKPVVLGEWNFTVGQTYLVPFILEFTNHNASYFSFHEPVNGEQAGWYYPDVNGNSNVYTNMEFKITKLSLTHVTETN